MLLLCLVHMAVAKEKAVKLLIAPRSLELPASGKVVLDVYWHNWTDKPATIPALDTYSVQSSIIVPGREEVSGGTTGRAIDHPAPDRTIPPHGFIHDTITADVDLSDTKVLKPKYIVEVSLSVTGEHGQEFESNTVVLTRK